MLNNNEFNTQNINRYKIQIFIFIDNLKNKIVSDFFISLVLYYRIIAHSQYQEY